MANKKCPNCQETILRRADRRGVEIDYCPDCNGIWLDNGELSKIVNASLEEAGQQFRIEPAEKKKSALKSFLSFLGKSKIKIDMDDDDDDDDFSSDFSDSESDSNSDNDDSGSSCDDN